MLKQEVSIKNIDSFQNCPFSERIQPKFLSDVRKCSHVRTRGPSFFLDDWMR